VSEETEAKKRERETDHITPSFLIVVQKYYIDSVSRTDGAIIGRNREIGDKNRIPQKI
jgi:hypothetical protein